MLFKPVGSEEEDGFRFKATDDEGTTYDFAFYGIDLKELEGFLERALLGVKEEISLRALSR